MSSRPNLVRETLTLHFVRVAVGKCTIDLGELSPARHRPRPCEEMYTFARLDKTSAIISPIHDFRRHQ